MTKDDFRTLCVQVLLPRLRELLRPELAEQKDILATILRETIRVREELDALEFALANSGHAGDS